MANVFRSEVVLKGSDAAIESFVDRYFSLAQERKYLDFEKVLPLNGEQPYEVWGSSSEAYNFEIVRSCKGEFVFRFDVAERLPVQIFLKLLCDKGSFSEISVVSCCEFLSEVLELVGKKDLFITNLYWEDRTPLSRKLIKKTGKRLWGYSKRPNLETQGFIHVGGGQFIKIHFDPNGLEDLYPRFKKA